MTDIDDLVEQPDGSTTPRFNPLFLLEGAQHAAHGAFQGIPFAELTHDELYAVAGHLMFQNRAFVAELQRRDDEDEKRKGIPRLILPSDM